MSECLEKLVDEFISMEATGAKLLMIFGYTVDFNDVSGSYMDWEFLQETVKSYSCTIKIRNILKNLDKLHFFAIIDRFSIDIYKVIGYNNIKY